MIRGNSKVLVVLTMGIVTTWAHGLWILFDLAAKGIVSKLHLTNNRSLLHTVRLHIAGTTQHVHSLMGWSYYECVFMNIEACIEAWLAENRKSRNGVYQGQ